MMPARPGRAALAAGLLLALLVLQVVFAMRQKSPTSDEFYHHVANGYSYLVTGDFRMNPASPPLPRMLAGVPLLFLKAEAPLDHPSWREGNSPVFAKQFFHSYNDNTDELIFWARVPIVLLSVVFGIAVFWFARSLFGEGAALAALVLYVFCPDILAHSGIAAADLAVAFFFFLALARFWCYLKAPTARNLVWTGVAAGLALLSKFTAALLFPALFLIALSAGKGRAVSPARTAAFLLVVFFTVWAGYFFELKPLMKNTPDPPKKAAMYEKVGGKALLQFAEKVPVPLSTFASAVVSMGFTRAAGTNAFLMGEWSREGWWYYYFVAFAIKNTVPFLLLAILAFLFIRKLGLDRVSTAVLVIPVILFFLLTMRDKAQAGIRYFLPVYPLFFVLAAGAAAHLWKRGKIAKTLVAGLLVWHAAEALAVFPHHLAYFNQLIGGPGNGYRYLRDSNLDWGQELKPLGKFVREAGYTEVVLQASAGADPAYYGIPYRKFEDSERERPKETVYAVSAHYLDSVKWTKRVEPTKVLGHAMFIYDLRRGSPDLSSS
jgi:hypothetical protein